MERIREEDKVGEYRLPYYLKKEDGSYEMVFLTSDEILEISDETLYLGNNWKVRGETLEKC